MVLWYIQEPLVTTVLRANISNIMTDGVHIVIVAHKVPTIPMIRKVLVCYAQQDNLRQPGHWVVPHVQLAPTLQDQE